MIMANKQKNDAITPVEEVLLEQSTQAPVSVSPTATPCSCTKISTMQMFHEMKQQFPTVPDTVVCEFVEQNCHNPEACLIGLQNYPNSVNVYPQALRNQPMKKYPNRNLNQIQKQQMASMIDKDPNENQIKFPDGNSTSASTIQRPNTLNLITLNSCTRPVCKPTRTAPPPPTAAIIQQQKSNANEKTLNLSLNVIVSPVTSGGQTPTRPPRSNVAFTLHQANNSKTVTIPVNTQPEQTTAESNENGPSLTYTSSAYDAEIGYQSRLEITVAGTSPMNDGPNLLNINSVNTRNKGNNTPVIDSNYNNGVSIKSLSNTGLPSVTASSQFLEESETVHHQLLCKQRLEIELDEHRKILDRKLREVQALQQQIPDGGLTALTEEIENLRIDCKQMAQEVLEAGPSYKLGETNEAFYKNIYTGQQLPVQPRQQLRPHRPAPVPNFNVTQNVNQSINNYQSLPTIQSTSQIDMNDVGTSDEAPGWQCNMCTFRNKLTQRKCELCAMPFLSAGNTMAYNGPYMQTLQSYPLTHYVPVPYQQPNSLPVHYLIYQPTSLPPPPPSQQPQYFNGFQSQTMTAYQNP